MIENFCYFCCFWIVFGSLRMITKHYLNFVSRNNVTYQQSFARRCWKMWHLADVVILVCSQKEGLSRWRNNTIIVVGVFVPVVCQSTIVRCFFQCNVVLVNIWIIVCLVANKLWRWRGKTRAKFHVLLHHMFLASG